MHTGNPLAAIPFRGHPPTFGTPPFWILSGGLRVSPRPDATPEVTPGVTPEVSCLSPPSLLRLLAAIPQNKK